MQPLLTINVYALDSKLEIIDQQKSKIAAEVQKKSTMSYPMAAAAAAATSGSDEQKCAACK